MWERLFIAAVSDPEVNKKKKYRFSSLINNEILIVDKSLE